MPPDKKLFILIGLPGSGKSTFARKLKEEYDAVICSTDDQFIDSKTGTYKFDARKLGWAHEQNQFICQEYMKAGFEVIVIDNTNLTRKERKPYVELAEIYGYEIEEVIIGGCDEEAIQLSISRNTHNVPEENIRRMAQKLANDLQNKS